ncbi:MULTISPECIES: hypothetical protein [Spirulina sp. CCY15215]|uniref:hypothetical protein n=1 Tax=Spirulina sp. CCY15215 TaxID=2767591 RepID=UPI00195109D3|nr:hypothetical protein [Spirulina major]
MKLNDTRRTSTGTSTNFLGKVLGAISFATLGTLTLGLPAEAFTIGYNGYFGSTNDPATGASATVDFTFTDLADGKIKMELFLTNTTGQANMTEGLLTDGATESEFLAVGFDFANGNLADKLNVVSYSLGSPAFDRLVYNDTSLTGGTSSSTAINGDGWGNISLNNISFDIGLVTTNNLLSGGSPRDGLNAGQSETVTFNLAPTDFVNAAELEQWFIDGFVENGYLKTAARFKAVDGTNINDGSDKLMGGNLEEYSNYIFAEEGGYNDAPPPPVDIPEPGMTMALAAFVLGGSKFRRKNA